MKHFVTFIGTCAVVWIFFNFSLLWAFVAALVVLIIFYKWPKRELRVKSPAPAASGHGYAGLTDAEKRAQSNAEFDALFANDPEYGLELALNRLSDDDARRLFGATPTTRGEMGPDMGPLFPLRHLLEAEAPPEPVLTFKSRRTVADTPETMSIAWYLGIPSPRTYSVG